MADEALKALVAEALYKHLDEKKREELIKGALASLLEEKSIGYGPRRSDLKDAFDQAVRTIAFEVARERLREDAALKAKLSELFAQAWIKAVENSDSLIQDMSEGILRVLTMRQ